MKKIVTTLHYRDLIVEDESTQELEEILVSNVSLWPSFIKIEGYLIPPTAVRAILPFDPSEPTRKDEGDNVKDKDEEEDIITT